MLTGTAADVNTAYGLSGISNLGDEAVMLSDTSASADHICTDTATTDNRCYDSDDVDYMAAANSVLTHDMHGDGDEAVTLSERHLRLCSKHLMGIRLVLQMRIQ